MTNAPRLIDLHTHTTASDGSDAPAELVRLAAQAHLIAVAITDHDTTAGLDAACEAGKQYAIEVIRGCELGVRTPYGELHLLGLWLPEHDATLDTTLATLRTLRTQRNKAIIDKLQEMDINITYDDVIALSGGFSVGRPHIALALCQKGYVNSVQEAFKQYLGHNAAAYVPKQGLSPQEGVSILANSGATVCIAHPMLLHCPDGWLDDTIAELRPHGLHGIEAYHSEHSHKDERYCVELAAKHNLVLSGGSDYHGKAKPAISLGKGRGSLRVAWHVLDGLKRHRQQKGLPV